MFNTLEAKISVIPIRYSSMYLFCFFSSSSCFFFCFSHHSLYLFLFLINFFVDFFFKSLVFSLILFSCFFILVLFLKFHDIVLLLYFVITPFTFSFTSSQNVFCLVLCAYLSLTSLAFYPFFVQSLFSISTSFFLFFLFVDSLMEFINSISNGLLIPFYCLR